MWPFGWDEGGRGKTDFVIPGKEDEKKGETSRRNSLTARCIHDRLLKELNILSGQSLEFFLNSLFLRRYRRLSQERVWEEWKAVVL